MYCKKYAKWNRTCENGVKNDIMIRQPRPARLAGSPETRRGFGDNHGIMEKDRRKRTGWNVKKYIRILLLQTGTMLPAALALALTQPIRWLFLTGKWVLMPLLAGFSAFRTVLRGINPYLAWIIPPLMATIAGMIASMGYTPDAGGVFFCALIALTGAAAGDVTLKTQHKADKRRKGSPK